VPCRPPAARTIPKNRATRKSVGRDSPCKRKRIIGCDSPARCAKRKSHHLREIWRSSKGETRDGAEADEFKSVPCCILSIWSMTRSRKSGPGLRPYLVSGNGPFSWAGHTSCPVKWGPVIVERSNVFRRDGDEL